MAYVLQCLVKGVAAANVAAYAVDVVEFDVEFLLGLLTGWMRCAVYVCVFNTAAGYYVD